MIDSSTDIDNREQAPIPAAAWKQLEDTARDILAENCSARLVCELIGPLGLDVAAVNTGAIDVVDTGSEDLVWGLRESRPLIEVRVPFTLSLAQVLHVAHGARDTDWSRLETAAHRYAAFEDRAIYHGLTEIDLPGMLGSFSQKALTCNGEAADFLATLGQARCALREADMGDQGVLVVGDAGRRLLSGVHAASGSPLEDVAGTLIKGPIRHSPALDHALLLAPGPGRFELTIGQDVSLRFVDLSGDDLSLGFLGTFAFRLLEDRAGIVIRW